MKSLTLITFSNLKMLSMKFNFHLFMEFGGTPDVLHFLLRFGSCSNSRGGRNGISDRNIGKREALGIRR